MEHGMTFLQVVSVAALGATSLLSGIANAAASSEPGTLQITRTFPADSPAVAQVHRWLLAQPSRQQPPASAAELGQLRTSYRTHAPAAGGRADLTSSEVAFPEHGQPGDAVAIDACGAGMRYHWTYRWTAASATAGWQLQSYHLRNVQDCAAAMADPDVFKPTAPRG
ncbi:hypothetical protein GW16_02515 [Xanthomonas arboricola pv. celebensis]|uniref:hypothetical protein n=1 Tax=Xanthomonas arboricola TaxID=56448 RepID=UPI0004DA539E|nr:hypothetical protein [Xanthomonas arboricola]KER88257.1 hypothetical protein GW16_02515 [Xanthomonas arboricola pv. celebensis]